MIDRLSLFVLACLLWHVWCCIITAVTVHSAGLATRAGIYSINIQSFSLMQVLKGSPFAIGIAPGVADAAKSTATIEAAGRSERRLEAGQELVVAIQLHDAFGNPTVTVGRQQRLLLGTEPACISS